MQKTFNTAKQNVVRKQVILDANGQVLGRLATNAANLLQGKHKAYYSHSVDCGDFITVINAEKVKTTGNKAETKTYFRHSGYPGGDTLVPFLEMQKKFPDRIIYHAVSGMLPKNKLRAKMLKRLKIFKGDKHAAV